jgi:hypothetical protein
VADADYAAEVAKRLGRPFDQVQNQLEEFFDREWDDVAVVIETSSEKTGRSFADVIVDLIERSERKPSTQTRIKRSVVRWIGKPWRERENPWDRFKENLPPDPPKVKKETDDLDEWTPLKPDDD